MTYKDRQNTVTLTFSDGLTYKPEMNVYSGSIKHFITENNGLGQFGSTDIQETGVGLRKIPLILTFFGDDHDIIADQFRNSASKTGTVIFQPPYGNQINGIISTIGWRVSTVDDIAATIFNVEFVESSGVQTPVGGQTQQNNIISQSSNVNDSAAELFTLTKAINVAEESKLIEYYSDSVDAVNEFLRPIAASQDDILTAFDATYNNIKENINDVISEPLLIATQTATLISLPTTVIAQSSQLISSYTGLIESQFIDPFTFNNAGRNNAITSQFFGGAAISALSSALVQTEYDNAPQVIDTVINYIDTYNQYRENVDNIQEDFDTAGIELNDTFIQTGILDVPLNYLAQQTAGALINEAFDAKREIKLSLDYETTALNIAIEYYPEDFVLDEESTLSYVIDTNNLTGDELFLIPRRRDLVVYV